MNKKIIGTCPLCGGSVVKTSRGFKCENNSGPEPACGFFINSLVGNRRMADEEVSLLLAEKEALFDGFVSKEQKSFPSVLRINESGEIDMNSVVGKCPNCGGDIRVSAKAFGCSNYRHPESPCAFTVWRSIFGHDVSLKEIRELCQSGITSEEHEFYNADGAVSLKRLKLAEDKLKAELS